MSSQPLSYALITPTFRGDYERCRLLVETAARHVAPKVRHYLVVDRRDAALFQPLCDGRTTLLLVEDIVPWWIFRIPGIPKVWCSLATRPVRNWILQQIVKLSVPGHVAEDVLMYADSDVFFCAPFDPATLEREGRVPLQIETGQRGLIPSNDLWHQVAARLLGIPVEDSYDTNFIGNVVFWRRDHALALREHLERVNGKSLPRLLAGLNVFSEYIVYGMFVSRVLGEHAGQWHDGLIRTLGHWQPVPLDEAGLRALKASRLPHQFSVMISAKSRTPVELVRKVFQEEAA